MSAQDKAFRAQDLHGALLARLQPRAPAGGPDDVARLPVALREAAWVEAADCFAGMLPGAEARRPPKRACITQALGRSGRCCRPDVRCMPPGVWFL